jgi:hypothetical protein
VLRRNQGSYSSPSSIEHAIFSATSKSKFLFRRQGWYVNQGKVYDVTGNKAYEKGGSYHGEIRPYPYYETRWVWTKFPHVVFAGHDASRALGLTSTKPEDVRPDWETLSDKEKGVLEDWVTFFSKRYNIVGVVKAADS